MTETIEQMIVKLEELKYELYDKESYLLRIFADRNPMCDFNGDTTREIAHLRSRVELLDRTIKMLKSQEQN
jgi:hypothetical protein